MTKEFELSEEQHKRLLDACRPIPMVMLQCGEPPSPQETANAAWQELAKEMGFKWDTAQSVPSKTSRFFTAECGDGELCACGYQKGPNHEHICGRV